MYVYVCMYVYIYIYIILCIIYIYIYIYIHYHIIMSKGMVSQPPDPSCYYGYYQRYYDYYCYVCVCLLWLVVVGVPRNGGRLEQLLWSWSTITSWCVQALMLTDVQTRILGTPLVLIIWNKWTNNTNNGLINILTILIWNKWTIIFPLKPLPVYSIH